MSRSCSKPLGDKYEVRWVDGCLMDGARTLKAAVALAGRYANRKGRKFCVWHRATADAKPRKVRCVSPGGS